MRMSFLIALFFGVHLMSAEDTHLLLSEGSKQMISKEAKTAEKGAMDAITKQTMQKAISSPGTRDVMIVDPQLVSKDWVDAFRALNTKRISEIVFLLYDQSSITNVMDIEAMPGGYLMLFTVKTVQGPKYQIIKTSDIATLISK